MKKITILIIAILLVSTVYSQSPLRIVAKNQPISKQECISKNNMVERAICLDRWCSSFSSKNIDQVAECQTQFLVGNIECLDNKGNPVASGEDAAARVSCSPSDQSFVDSDSIQKYCTERGYIGCNEVRIYSPRECISKIGGNTPPIVCEPYRTDINCFGCSETPTQEIEDCTCTPEGCREGKLVVKVEEPWLGEEGLVPPAQTQDGQACVDPTGKPVEQGGVKRCSINPNNEEQGCALPCTKFQDSYCCDGIWTDEPCYDLCGEPVAKDPVCEETCDYEEECLVDEYVPPDENGGGFLCDVLGWLIPSLCD